MGGWILIFEPAEPRTNSLAMNIDPLESHNFFSRSGDFVGDCGAFIEASLVATFPAKGDSVLEIAPAR